MIRRGFIDYILVIMGTLWVGWLALSGAALAQEQGPSAQVFLPDLPTSYNEWCTVSRDQVTDMFCQMEPAQVELTSPMGTRVIVHVLVAQTPGQRAAGYQHIAEDVIARSAILFRFEQEISGAFHMCNVEAPLDIMWVRKDGTLLDAKRMLPGAHRPASTCGDIYASGRAGRYGLALETPAELLAPVGFDIDNPVGWELKTLDTHF